MGKVSPQLNEWIARELEFDPDFGFAHKELVPRWAVAHVRKKIFQHEKETTFHTAWDVAVYLEKVLCQDVQFIRELQSLNKDRYYSAVFRPDGLHIFKDEVIRERIGDVKVKGVWLEKFMKHIVHSDWKIDLDNFWKLSAPEELVERASDWKEQSGESAFFFKVSELNKLPMSIKLETI
ncbi:hypothetical protein JMA_44260 (plasmid) [Jeotgalibacillus malaysiensis]|uniref:Uncharacterized protein n=1 Tax=Jeotgalibacillus malaysiensis TaxID=1508404 RepID=A0A0B5AZ23_9BACL|nr:hypothetical protein [Jeotgalibacillus malaysiensis]AJD93743.1 hypothetical protein JMA_44260 [Jeotgalibacillus malaysiensis]